MEVLKTIRDILQLRLRSVISASGKNQRAHQAKPVCLVDADVIRDVSVRHQLCNHRKPVCLRFNFDSEEL